MHCCAGSNGQTRPGQRLALFVLALPPRNRTKARKFLSPVWRFQSCLSFDPLIIGTGKLYLNDDNGWLYSLCDAIRQRYIFPFTMVLYIHALPSAHKAFFLSTNQPIYLHSIPIERPEKPYPTNKSIQVTYTSNNNNNNNNTLSSHPNRPKKKPFLTNIHSQISITPKQCLTQLLLSPQPLLHQVLVSMIST